MSVVVRIPILLQRMTGQQREIVVAGADIAEVIAAMDKAHPGVRGKLCDEGGALRRFVIVFVDGVDVRSLQGTRTRTPPGCEIDIVSAIAGG